MGVIVPVGEYTATAVLAVDGSTKTPTWGFGFQYTGPNPEPSEAALAQAVYNSLTGATVAPYDMYSALVLNTAWRFLGVSVSRMTVDGPLIGEHFVTVQGVATGETPTINTSYLVTKRTAKGGRKNRGRCYPPLCNVNEGQINQVGTIFGTNHVAQQAFWTQMMAQLESNFISPVLHHSDGSVGTQLTGFFLETTVATQRRRMR